MFQNSSHSPSVLSRLLLFLKKPQAFPFLLSIFLLLTWLSFSLHHSSHFSPPFPRLPANNWSKEDDTKVNLVRFSSAFPSTLAKDERGWLLNPISLALRSSISGGAETCISVHVGEIRPGAVRGNHRHYTCNETFVIWGAKTKFRLETSQEVGKGFAEVTISADEVAVAVSPSGSAHALINTDSIRSTFFIGCQDSVVNYNVDFREIVNRLPKGASFTFISDSCHSGGLIDKDKEQIGPSSVTNDCQLQCCTPKTISFESLLQHLTSVTNINTSDIGTHFLQLFGADASLRFRLHPLELDLFESLKPDEGILLSGCQANETSADMNPMGNGGKAYGAFSNAVQTVLNDHLGPLTNREIVLKTRKALQAAGLAQHPCLYCSDENAGAPFLWQNQGSNFMSH